MVSEIIREKICTAAQTLYNGVFGANVWTAERNNDEEKRFERAREAVAKLWRNN